MKKGSIEMKKKSELITCPCCGHMFEVDIVLSMFQQDVYLDGKPEKESQMTNIYECPSCHYLAIDMEKKVTDKVKEIVYSSEYKELLKDELTKYKAAIMLSEQETEQLILLLQLCWKLEFSGKLEQARLIRIQIAEHLGNMLNEEPKVEYALLYVEMLRLLDKLGEASNIVHNIKANIEMHKDSEPHIYNWYLLENELIKQKDSEPHKQSEMVL